MEPLSPRELQALLQARELLSDLGAAWRTPKITRDLRARARAALRHFPPPKALIACAQSPRGLGLDQWNADDRGLGG